MTDITAAARACKHGIVCLTGDFDPALIPPHRVERSTEQCNHTPCPEVYNAWNEWAHQASKTHRQVRCPRCSLWAIWLPKAEAREINKREEREAREFAKAYLKHCEQQRKARK